MMSCSTAAPSGPDRSHHQGIGGPHAERAHGPVEHAWVGFLDPLFKRQREHFDAIAEPGGGKCRPHVEVDIAENGHQHTAPSQLEHGADRVIGKWVVAGIRLDGVQGAGQVVVAPRVVEHLEVGPPVVVRVRIDAGALKAVAHTARGAN